MSAAITNAPSNQRGKRMLKKIIPAAGLVLAALLPFGCAQNDPDAPSVGGPSTGLIITKVTAIPDVLPADGFSESTLRLEHRLRDGNPLPGRHVAFYVVGVQTGAIPGLDESIALRFCSALSSIGGVTVSTDVTDANGVAWGAFRAGIGAIFGEDRTIDPNLPPDDPCDCTVNDIYHSPNQFWTTVRGRIVDPRESEGEYETEDDIRIEQYGGGSFACL